MIKGLLNQTIAIQTKTGYDTFGREIHDTASNIRCRFQKSPTQRLLPNGSFITIEAIVYVGADESIDIDDKVVFDGTDYKVYGKYQAVDGLGNTNHYKLELTKWQT